MNLRACILFVALVVVTAAGCAGVVGDDMAAPDPGAELTASMPTPSSVWLHWTTGVDDTTLAARLEYRAFFSPSDELGSVLSVLTQGTPASEWRANASQLRVDGLALDTTYYFNVLVRDEAGNMAVYPGASATTLGGSWREVEPLEDSTEHSARFTALHAGHDGAVVAHWRRYQTRERHFATRAQDEDTFGADTPWSAAGIHTPEIGYGFDGRLMGASFRDNDDDTRDVLFGSRVDGQSTTFETIATGLVAQFSVEALACVAENGEAMVVWVDATSNTSASIRARFRTENGWGSTSLVSGSEGLTVSYVSVVCSPDGNHIVVYLQREDPSIVVHARVYDADRSDWEAPALPFGTSGTQVAIQAVRAADGRVVVAWQEQNDDVEGQLVRARIHDRNGWSPANQTLFQADLYVPQSLSLAAAGNDFHAVWLLEDALTTRRLAGGSSTWSAETPLGSVDGIHEHCVAGDPLGGVLLAWLANGAVSARTYARNSGTWGPVQPILTAQDSIHHQSIACIVDPRRRATIAWTSWSMRGEPFSAFARTYR